MKLLFLGVASSCFFIFKNATVNFLKSISEEMQLFLLFLKQHLSVVICSTVIALITYTFEIVNFTLSMDEETAMTGLSNIMQWMFQGRFGIFLIDKLFWIDELFIPTLAAFLAVFILSFSALIIAYLISIITKAKISNWVLIFFTGSFISMPIVNPDFMTFSIYNFEIALAIMAASLVVYLFFVKKQSRKIFILEAVLLVFSFSIYQSMVPFYITLFIFVLFMKGLCDKIDYKSMWELMVRGAFLAFLSMIIYFIIYKGVFWIYNVENETYLNNFIGWGRKENFFNDFIYAILMIGRTMSGFFVYATNILYVYYVLAIVVFFMLCSHIKKGICVFLFICYCLAPFSLILVFASQNIPMRTLLPLPLWCAGWIIIFALVMPKKELLYKYFILIMCGTIVFQVQASVSIYVSDNKRFENDKRLSEHIMSKVFELDEYDEKIPIVFIGSIDVSSDLIKRDTIGLSFYEQINNHNRIHPLLKYLNYKIAWPSPNDILVAEAKASDMSVWPNKGSVDVYQNLIIVKLS